MSNAGGAAPPDERRAAPRFRVRAPVEYADSASGRGITWDVSLSGVRIEGASASVPVGRTLTLRFSFFAGSFDTPLSGRVVRHTGEGFAVAFTALEPAQLDLLQRALPPTASD